MESLSKLLPTEAEKDRLIDALTPELLTLRTKAEISQEELSVLIGISRQTYGAIERKLRKMSWSTYLSLIMLYDCNQKTHQMIRASEAFPYEIIKCFNNGVNPNSINMGALGVNNMNIIIDSLDEQALMSIKTMIMVEYARCTSTPGDVVIRSFDGISFNTTPLINEKEKAAQALRAIKEKKKHND